MSKPTTTQWTPVSIYEQVQDIIDDGIGVDREEIRLTATLTEDLGVESIDFLDLSFRMQRAFGIIMPTTRSIADLQSTDPSREINPETIAMIKESMPFLESEIQAMVPDKQQRVGDIFTVETLCKIAAHLLKVPWVTPVSTSA